MSLDCLNQNIQHLKAELSHGVLTLYIDRPEAKNAIYSELYLALEQALYQADASPIVRSVILRGAQQDFTAGNDMQDFAKNLHHSTQAAQDSPPFLLLKSTAKFSKPLIIAVKGVAIGIGVTILLHADFVYADESCLFQIPFVSLGLSPEGCSSKLLQQQAGYLLAADLLMTARKFDVHTAYQARLITQICDDPYQQAQHTAKTLAQLPLASLKQSKALMKANLNEIVDWIDHEAKIFMQRVKSPEMREALSAFKEKRKADFSQFS
ncbi:enoyl-CoA hydratase [Acinetobacter qingfengensis]|uniref:Enoyl-CoA hydratase n=1 Tax=Acinetobacter qingfengensis TaxID=1262585 RepID=A0A1E7RDU9_9GAMM|nr:enoyl-CoA hydratase-related protein [Acinetobacter qingfengensis]KAA8735288.1 enoyl-CoA hydratase [Acinetobacter qingfengensis]OEY97407.1 enoyl-CoA hydratase [Acinetobacter qingfengensis]